MTEVPQTLAALDRWIVWRMENGRKVPYQARNGFPARTTEPHHFGTLEQAQHALQEDAFTGLGFVFHEGDGLVGVDLDDCFEDGPVSRVKPWARTVVEALSQVTYTEISPSGTGLKAWCRGVIPKALKVPVVWSDGKTDGAIEVYNKARYFAFTGRRYNNAPLEVADCQVVLDFIYETLAPQRSELNTTAYPLKFEHGTQHNNLVRILGVLRRHNVCERAIEACLQIVNQEQCERPGPQENITQMVRSSREWGRDE